MRCHRIGDHQLKFNQVQTCRFVVHCSLGVSQGIWDHEEEEWHADLSTGLGRGKLATTVGRGWASQASCWSTVPFLEVVSNAEVRWQELAPETGPLLGRDR